MAYGIDLRNFDKFELRIVEKNVIDFFEEKFIPARV